MMLPDMRRPWRSRLTLPLADRIERNLAIRLDLGESIARVHGLFDFCRSFGQMDGHRAWRRCGGCVGIVASASVNAIALSKASALIVMFVRLLRPGRVTRTLSRGTKVAVPISDTCANQTALEPPSIAPECRSWSLCKLYRSWDSRKLRTHGDAKILTHPHFAVEPLKSEIDGTGTPEQRSGKLQRVQSESGVNGAGIRNILPAIHPPMDPRGARQADDEAYSWCD